MNGMTPAALEYLASCRTYSTHAAACLPRKNWSFKFSLTVTSVSSSLQQHRSTFPVSNALLIRARYELLPKDASVMSESTSKSSGSNHWDWLKNLWEEMIKFLKKIAETVKKHPYITAVVFFLLFIAIILYLAVRRRTKDAEEPEHVSSRWHRGPKRGRRR